MNKFTFNLFQNLVNSSHENLLLFPLNIAKFLFMLFLGSAERAAVQIEKIMGMFLYSTDFHTDIHNFFYEWRRQKKSHTYKAIDKMYVASSVTLRTIYKRIVRMFYPNVLTFVNFSEAGNRINNLIAMMSHGFIRSIKAEKEITSDMLLSLWSVVFFNGEWNSGLQSPRKDNSLKNKDVGNSNFVTASLNYRKDEVLNCQMVELPIENKTLSLLLVMPYQIEHFKKLMRIMNKDILNSWVNLKGFEKTRVVIQKVKFEVHGVLHLEKILPKLGITYLFKKSNNLSKMSHKKELFVNNFIQKSFMQIRPDTETVIRNAKKPFRKVLIEVNVPFFFFIVDKDSKMVISAGSVVDQ